MTAQTLKAKKREVLGGKVKYLRREGVLPANIYGKKVKSQAVQVSMADFVKVYKKAGETGIVNLAVDGKKKPVLIHSVQTDPVSDQAIHADFLQVNLKEKITTQVPVELSGTSSGEKEGKGVVIQQIDEVEVEALPTDLPERFEVDLTKLKEVNDAIYVKEISYDKKKVKIESDPSQLIVKLEPPRKEEVTAKEEEVVEEEAPEEEESEKMEVAEGEEEKKTGTKEDKPSTSQKT